MTQKHSFCVFSVSAEDVVAVFPRMKNGHSAAERWMDEIAGSIERAVYQECSLTKNKVKIMIHLKSNTKLEEVMLDVLAAIGGRGWSVLSVDGGHEVKHIVAVKFETDFGDLWECFKKELWIEMPDSEDQDQNKNGEDDELREDGDEYEDEVILKPRGKL